MELQWPMSCVLYQWPDMIDCTVSRHSNDGLPPPPHMWCQPPPQDAAEPFVAFFQ